MLTQIINSFILQNLTFEKVEELRKQLAEKTAELEELESTEPRHIWLNDLDAIEVALDGRDREIEQAEEDESNAQKKTAARQATKGKKKAAPRKRVAKKKKAEEIVSIPEDEVAKPAATASRARKPAAKKAPKIDVEEEDDDDDDDLELSLFDRLKLSKTISNDSSESSMAGSKRPSPKGAASKKASTKRAKATSKAAPKKKAAKAKDVMDFSEEEDFLCSDSESDMEVEIVAPPTRPRRGGRAKSKPATYAVVDDDDSFMVDSDDESDF